MALGLNLGEDLHDFAVRPDQKGCALDAHDFLAVHVLFFEHPKLIADNLVYISEQRIRQVVFFFELLLRFGSVTRNAEHYRSCFLQTQKLITETAGLDGASWRVSFGVKEKNYGLARKIGEAYRIAVLILESKISYLVMFLHQVSSLPKISVITRQRVTRLFRISSAFALGSACMCGVALGQYPGQIDTSKKSTNPRAVAVLEYTGDPAKPTASRLVPVSYYLSGEYQDAGIYLAQPAPIALGAETEYELQRAGVPAGVYDIDEAGRIGDAWFGYGVIKAKVVAKSNGTNDEDDARPRLTKSATPSAAQASATPTATTGGNAKPDSTETATPTQSSPLDGKDRPTLKRRATPIGQQQKIPANDASIDDPDRPHLGHSVAPAEKPGAKHLIGNAADVKQVVAVSDATTKEPHPFAYTWGSADDETHAEQTLRSAVESKLKPATVAKPTTVAKPARGSRGLVGKTRKPAQAEAPAPLLTDVHIAAYALTYENTPTLVLSAKTTEATPRDVTVIAEVDIYNEPQILFMSTTDAAHLIDTPDMRLVDAVDADGSNRASLLFELRGTTDRQFALYRVSRGMAQRTFVTGSVPYQPPIPAAGPS